MGCSASYSLSDDAWQMADKGDAQIRLEEENISLPPKFADPLFLSRKDILENFENVHKIHLTLA